MLTNTERQQIVEEVNAGTYGIDEALDDIAAAQKGEEVRKALYAEALVLNREGHAGSTDMIARQQVANLQTSVNGQISTLRTEVGDDIDDLEEALNSGLAAQNGKIAAQDATIANVVANYNVEYGSTELWASTGETGALAAGTTVTLSEDVSHFDYIDIYSFCGNSNVLDTVPVDAKLQSSQGYALRWVNLSDPDSGSYKAYVRIIETRLHIIGTTLTIDHQVTYRNGEEVNISGAEITQSNRSTYMGELGIMKVVGRKITANTEIEDVRIGADGTEYDSAGQAVRAQVNDLYDAIPAIDDGLDTAGAAADAKIVGDEFTNVKADLGNETKVINTGDYTIQSADLVSGVWGYTTPTDNANRLRSSDMFPVKKDAIINYVTGTGQEIYLGLAKSKTSGSSDFLTTGWVSGTGSWTIAKDGYMTFNVRKSSGDAISISDYNSGVTIRTALRKNVDKSLKSVFLDATTASLSYDRNAENLLPNTYSWIGMSFFNDLPSDVSSSENGWIFTFSPHDKYDNITVKTQFLLIPNPRSDSFTSYYRRMQNGTMSAWRKTYDFNSFMQNIEQLPSGDIDDITGNVCAILISTNTYTHAPFTIGTIFSVQFSSILAVQLGFQFTTGVMYYRRKSTTWGDWITLNPNTNKYRTTGKYVAFGDSLTWGAVWSPTSGTAYHRVKEEWRIPTRIALVIGMINNFSNEAIGGIGYFKEEGGETLISQVADYTFTGVELVTVMAGANDHYRTDLGTASDADTAQTICGAIKNIIHTIAAKNPKTQIIIMCPLPCGVDGTQYDVWTSKQGDGYLFKWSIAEFDEQVSTLCKNEHVGYLNWNDSTYCRNWTNAGYNLATGPNYTHPTADEDYYLLGNFMAGKVSSLYHGLN